MGASPRWAPPKTTWLTRPTTWLLVPVSASAWLLAGCLGLDLHLSPKWPTFLQLLQVRLKAGHFC